jgi:hypothetical protein
MIDGQVALVHNIIESYGQLHVVYEEFLCTECFFEYPCRSDNLGIFILSCLSGEL